MKAKVMVLIVLVVGFFAPKTPDFPTPKAQQLALVQLLDFLGAEVEYIVCTHEKLNARPVANIGDISFYAYRGEECEKLEFNSFAVVAESVVVYGDDYKKFLKNNDISDVKQEKYSGFLLLYCYSPRLHKYLASKGERFNLQVAIYNDYFKVGYPAIMDGF